MIKTVIMVVKRRAKTVIMVVKRRAKTVIMVVKRKAQDWFRKNFNRV